MAVAGRAYKNGSRAPTEFSLTRSHPPSFQKKPIVSFSARQSRTRFTTATMAFTVAVRLAMAVVVVAVFAGTAKSGEPIPGKNSKCHNPAIATCNTSIYPILDYQMSAWFYHEMFKSCRPLYSEYGVHHRCEANRDLPATREECERLCGVSCTSGDDREGICTFDEYCKSDAKRTVDHPKPCGAYGVICCPPRSAAAAEEAAAAVAAAMPQPAEIVPAPRLPSGARPIVNNALGDEERHDRYHASPVEPTDR